MTVTKIAVFVAHEGQIDLDRLQGVIEMTIGQEFERSNLVFEVRHDGSHEVTLASIVSSLEDREPLAYATDPETKEPIRPKF